MYTVSMLRSFGWRTSPLSTAHVTANRRPYHLVNCLYNSQHLVIANLPITIDVVKLECPIELVLHLASARDTQRADKLLEIDRARLVAVKDIEHVIRKGRWIAEREELPVDLLKLLFRKHTGGAILQKAWNILA